MLFSLNSLKSFNIFYDYLNSPECLIFDIQNVMLLCYVYFNDLHESLVIVPDFLHVHIVLGVDVRFCRAVRVRHSCQRSEI